MSRKLEKVRTDIRKAEAKLREAEEYLKTLQAKERQLEDEEIGARIRAMQEKGSDVLDLLETIQSLKQESRAAAHDESEPYETEVNGNEE